MVNNEKETFNINTVGATGHSSLVVRLPVGSNHCIISGGSYHIWAH